MITSFEIKKSVYQRSLSDTTHDWCVYVFLNKGKTRRQEINEIMCALNHVVIDNISLLKMSENDESAWRRVGIYDVNDTTDLYELRSKLKPHYDYFYRLQSDPLMLYLVEHYQTSINQTCFDEIYRDYLDLLDESYLPNKTSKTTRLNLLYALRRLFLSNNNNNNLTFNVTERTVFPDYNVSANSYKEYLNNILASPKNSLHPQCERS